MLKSLAFVFVLLQYRNTDTLQIYLEENKLTTFYCPPLNNSVSVLDLYLVINNEPQQLFSCTSMFHECRNYFGDIANLTNSGSYFPFTLNVNEKRTITKVICAFTFTTNILKWNISEDISFIAKAQDVTCFNAQLTNNNTHISVTCMTSKIYPKAHCLFSVTNQELGQVSYSHVNYSNIVKYYQSNCTWSASLSSFKRGNYTLDVSVYPSVPNGSNFATNQAMSIQLTIPKSYLSHDCFNGFNIVDGYIRPGSVAFCVCYLDSNGFPPTFIKWSNSSHSDLGRPINSTVTSLNIEPSINNLKYYCNVFTNLMNEDYSILYSVNYAKGPTTCSIELKDTTQTVWKICKNTFINWTVICQVNESDAIPGIKANIGFNSVYSPLLDSQNVTNMYQVKYEMNITEAANYSIGCQAQNIKFSDVNVTCSYPIVLQVMAPPRESPLLKITSNAIDIKDVVQEHKVYYVECAAYGGIPPANIYNVSCGNITESTQSGNFFTSLVTFERNMTGQNCTCTAQHITGCYENNTRIIRLEVLYMSTVIHFGATNTIVENGTFLQFYCTAEGYPPPNISISKGNVTIAQNSSGYDLLHNKSMYCKDSGTFICEANNGILFNNKNSKQITVFVRCPLQFTFSEVIRNFTFQEGKTFSYNVTMYGYPEPDKFIIYKSNKETTNIIITKLPLEAPYISVELKIDKITSSDFDHYTLVIFQSGVPSLTFQFTVIEEKETSINVAAVVGGCVAACFVVIIIVAVCYAKRKYEINLTCKKKHLNTSTKEPHNYSELSTVQHQDKHNYETPMSITNLSIPETTTQYINVKEQSQSHSAYEEIDNI